MKDHLIQQLGATPIAERRNLAREYLQVYVLRLLQETGANAAWLFVGGTALRLLYRLPRFSEDLDFTLASDAPRDPEPQVVFTQIKTELEKAAYDVRVKLRQGEAIASAMVRFQGLPAELGWSMDPRLAVSIRVEVDLRPPAGASVETTLLQRFFPVAVRHHDLPSLFAGKLHALLARPYAKGRDWYDLVWYLTEQAGLEPNASMLRAALEQTGHHDLARVPWRQAVLDRLETLDWSQVVGDLEPFMERPSDLEQLRPELVAKLVGRQGRKE